MLGFIACGGIADRFGDEVREFLAIHRLIDDETSLLGIGDESGIVDRLGEGVTQNGKPVGRHAGWREIGLVGRLARQIEVERRVVVIESVACSLPSTP